MVFKMRYLFVILLIGLTNVRVLCRPQNSENVEESEVDEAEYESGGAETDDAIEQEDDSRVAREESAVDEQDEDSEPASRAQFSNRNNFLRRVADKPSRNGENLSGFNPSKIIDDEAINTQKENIEYQSPSEERDSSKQRDSSRFITKNLIDQQFANREDGFKYLHEEKSPADKQALASRAVSNEEGDVLFERNENIQGRRERTNQNDYGRPDNSNLQFRQPKQFFNSIHEEIPDKHSKLNLDRDRRDAQDAKQTAQEKSSVGTNSPANVVAGANAAANAAAAANVAASSFVTSNVPPADIVANVAEDEEAAIKRHVQKLSAGELEELLNSLSEDKRQLLKKIMDSNNEFGNDINKREITKKAGAAPDDNTYLEGGQSDSNKLQEGCVGSELNLQTSSTEATEVDNKQQSPQPSEISVLPVTTKSLDTGNDSSFASLFSDKKIDTNIIDAKNQAEVKLSNPAPEQSKTSKREAGSNNLQENQNSFDADDEKFPDFNGYDCPREKDEFEYDDSQSELNKVGNALKREASEKDYDTSDSMKSLEESFPNSNSYDDNDPYSESENAPLVRVKRKNLDVSIKKRSANVMPDAKVGYFPYRAENDDEDNDEGNEFDDEGFYNPPSNLANSNVKETISENTFPSNLEDVPQKLHDNVNTRPHSISDFDSKSASLGSDTDSVFSGGEGIDENLMFSSASRNKRTVIASGDSKIGDESADDPKELKRLPRSSVLDDEIKSVTENYGNDQNFHDKDTYNPLPRSNEDDVARYKRIRRVKQPTSSGTEVITSDN